MEAKNLIKHRNSDSSLNLIDALRHISWIRLVKLVCYQLFFVIILTAYTALMIGFHFSTLDHFSPRIKRPNANPSLSVRPLNPKTPYSTLIEFTHGSNGDWKPLKDSMRDFIRQYSHGKYPGASRKCKWHSNSTLDAWCHVSKRRLIDWTHDVYCSKAEDYGYPMGQPCILLKVNKWRGWEPDPYYNMTEVRNHQTMPDQVKALIEKAWTKNCKDKGVEKEEKCPNLRVMWLHCDGVTAADTEHMGTIKYTPYPGFRGYFFPFLNQNHYLSPVVMMQFRKITPGVVIQIECKLWAKNVEHDPRNPFRGGGRFEILMN